MSLSPKSRMQKIPTCTEKEKTIDMKRIVSSTEDVTQSCLSYLSLSQTHTDNFIKNTFSIYEQFMKNVTSACISSLFCRLQEPIIKFENAPRCTDNKWSIPLHASNKWELAFYFEFWIYLSSVSKTLIISFCHIPSYSHTHLCTSCLSSSEWNEWKHIIRHTVCKDKAI